MPILDRNGVQVHYALSGDADGIPVVYAPGFGSHSGDILARLLQSFLAQSGFRLLTLDNRGSGQTITPPGAARTVEAMAEDAAAVMDAVGMPSAHVFGISMGGCVAALLALNFPDRVRSLTSVASFAKAANAARAGFILETMRLLRDAGTAQTLINRIGALYLISEADFTDSGLIEQWVNAETDPLAQDRAGCELQVDALREFDITPRLSEIHLPVLVMSSPDDFLLPTANQRAIYAGIPGARWVERPGGHAFMLEPQRIIQFIGDLTGFWSETEASRASVPA